MHEVSLCEEIIKLLQKNACAEHYSEIKQVSLEIGQLSCVQSEALFFAFEAVARGSVAEGAELHITKVPGKGWCQQCCTEVDIKQRYDCCPLCDYYPLEIRSGDQMRIKHVEVV